MKRNLSIVASVLALVVLPIALFWWWQEREFMGGYRVKPQQMYRFLDLSGPTNQTILAKAPPAAWTDYADGSTSRLAVLLTDTNSDWLGLAHGFKSIGVPFLITRDYRQALQHRVVLVYPMIAGSVMSPAALQAVAAHPRNGGTLLAVNVLGGGLNEVFEFADAVPSRKHFDLRLSPTNALTASFDEPEERVIRIASSSKSRLAIGTHSYTRPRSPPLAVYNDGRAAITYRSYEKGRAIAFGVDLGHVLLRGYNHRQEGIARSYVNEFEPSLDVLLRLIKKTYETGEPAAVTLGTVPFNRALTALITHDIDYTRSLSNAVLYAELEKNAGVRATYFLQTKYIRDYNDDAFFKDRNMTFVAQLRALGMEMGSHSVSHSVMFSDFPLGSGDEQYPAYTPFVRTRTRTYNGSILGELRVSKFLIEHFVPGVTVVSFRPGHLSKPFQLPEALGATGYRFSSSVAANQALTHLPFQVNRSREHDTESGVFEFPITIEDEKPPRLGDRLPQAIALARKVSRYGGCCVVLIHPDVVDHKLEFERGFVAAFKDTAWFDTVAGFGEWWSARNQISVDSRLEGPKLVVTLEIPKTIRGLVLEVPRGFRLQVSDSSGLRVKQAGERVVIEEAEGRVQMTLRR